MSGSLGRMSIQLDLNSIKFQQGLNEAQNQAKKFVNNTQRDLSSLEKAVRNISNSVAYSKWDILAKYGASIGKSALEAAESYTSLKNKISLVTPEQEKQALAMATIFDISQRTNQVLGATSDVYSRFASNADRLGLSQKQVASLTETVSKAVAMSGASADEAQRGLTQFGQALATGSLKGQDLNSIMQQIPGLADAIAKGLGVTTGELKELGAKGELSIPKVVTALENVKNQVDADFNKRIKTISASFTNLQNAFTKFVGETDQALGATHKLAERVEFFADNLDSVIKYVSAFAAALAIGQFGKYATKIYDIGIKSAQNVLFHKQETVAIYAKAKAMREEAESRLKALQRSELLAKTEQSRIRLQQEIASQTALVTSLTQAEATAKTNLATANTLAANAAKGLQKVMSLLGGPAGIVTIAGGALFYFSQQAEQARQKALDTAGANDRLKESYEGLSAAALSLKINQQMDDLANYDKQIRQLQSDIVSLEANWHISGSPIPDSVKKEVAELNDKISLLKENSAIDFSVLERQLEALATAMLSSGKNIDDVRQKFKTLGVDAGETEWILAGIPKVLEDVKNGAKKAEEHTLDFASALKKLNEKSQTMQQRLEVLTLKNKGHAKASYVLAGLYEMLGVAGAEYSQVLNAIANGDVAAAESAAKAINLSAEQLNTMLEMGKKIEGLFDVDQKTQTIEREIKLKESRTKPSKTKSGTKSKADYRKEFDSYFDDLKKTNADTLQNIDTTRANSLQKLNDLIKAGVVSHQEAEQAKTLITQRYLREREELAERYAPHLSAKNKMQRDLYNIQQLQSGGDLSNIEAMNASDRAKMEYAQQISQNAVSVQNQIKGMYDPTQELQNRQAQELALLTAFNDQKLITEEDFQKRKQELINRFNNEQTQKDLEYYATFSATMGSAFDSMANVMANAAGKQSGIYKAMFAASKAFAVAESLIKIKLGIANAASLPYPANLAAMASVATSTANIISTIQSVQMGYSSGGYTGDGGKFTPAGIVHRGEYVITKEATSRLGLDYLNYLNYGKRGFAQGGGIAVPRVPTLKGEYASNQAEQNNEVNITINIDKSGNTDTDEQQTAQQGKQLSNLIRTEVIAVLTREKRVGGLLH
ncbi:hypothetical protein BMT54_06515 [Pasteurellaceae bacterium 15-036681]|nr:hypothetical protein BMT54_06515 [Pasteurellaceae bacterium 15-036681]